MIQLLSGKYRKRVAYLLFIIFYISIVLPVYALRGRYEVNIINPLPYSGLNTASLPIKTRNNFLDNSNTEIKKINNIPGNKAEANKIDKSVQKFIDGPNQPEMSRFKPAGADNLVNLFTGDFSYNIPLLDVGGYPVNIFYNGGIGPEDEASWVGLGWNINPGTVSRNMRGVPDDFDGTDKLVTTQMMKPNITWGGRLGADFEIAGIKKATHGNVDLNIGGSLGVSVNNYLGPALELGIKGGASFKLASLASPEKKTDSISQLRIGVGVGANLSSRGGLTISPNVSLTASKLITDNKAIGGSLGLSTSYNSRTGISNLNINGQARFNYYEIKSECEDNVEVRYVSNESSISKSILSSSISFSKPSYIPSIRMPITNEAFSGHFQTGAGLWGIYPSLEIEVYKQTSTIEPASRIQTKPMVGYLYYQKANNNADAVVDFTRFNDKEVTDKTPVISVPQYSYDVFSINGEGTGGSIRLYRNDNAYVRDNYTKSQDKSLSIGADIGIGHYGANFNTIKTPSTIGEWNENNKLRDVPRFREASADNENVYFRNPGETSVLNADQYNKIGGADLVRYKLGGGKMNPSLEAVLERFAPDGKKLTDINQVSTAAPAARNKRTQVTSYLTAKEASEIGLDKFIKSYNNVSPITSGDHKLIYETIPRVGEYRQPHHISQISVTEANGSRYIYGIPVYNIIQTDFTFTVENNGAVDADLVTVNTIDTTPSSQWLQKTSKKDGYLQINQTPAYAHSFLLSGLLSPDYVDVTGDGITEDDLGNAVKFNYSRVKDGTDWAVHKWRTPHGSETNVANLNAGNKTDIKDDKGIISYGERESWYLHSIESKTMIALFSVENRSDGKGPVNPLGGRSGTDNSAKRLKQIDLYSKADLKKNGTEGAKPIKTVHFEYSYQLCPGTPDNASGGKLTLEKIYFTFNGKSRANKNQYKFAYASAGGNPAYARNTSDRWGTYKPASLNPGGLKNADYPYSFQPSNETEKETANSYASAWALKKILLPSGGQIEVEYESDDYAFVQDRRAATMMSIAGFGKNETEFSNSLYAVNLFGFQENRFVLINVPEGCATKNEVWLKYLKGNDQLSFKLSVLMPKGYENIMSYANFEDYGVYGQASDKKIWVKLTPVDGFNPLSITALEYLKEQLPGQAFVGYDVSEGTTLQQFGDMMTGMLMGLKNAFRDPIKAMRNENKAKYTELSKCFVRLNDNDGFKYGGGHRVKKVMLKDNWKAMTQQYTSQYGTEYDYTTTEIFNGQERTISSGVASYEPSIGGEENPFQTMIQISNRLPLGPTSYGSIEMPVLDAFFPAPIVGYSKVTVRSLKKGDIPQGYKSRSGIGRQVSEFYTAKDFPVYYNNTSFDSESDKQEHKNSFGAFFWKWAFDSRALSQGFLVATNDMHGKMKSQSSYAENDPSTRISYTENFYRNTGVNGMNEKFDFIHAAESGKIEEGNMGIDIELMTDTREFSVKSTGLEVQGQLDYFPGLIPGLAWLPFIWPVKSKSENTYRAVTCTKVINYHSIVDSVVVIDKTSQVSTKNLVYDAETGEVIINRTNNEFKKPVYSVSYPAYWAYSGMGLAYKNIDAVYAGVNFLDGRIISGISPTEITRVFESGDELYIMEAGSPAGCDPAMVSSSNEKLVWALDIDKDVSSLTNETPDFIFIDKDGKPYSRTGVKFRIVRSGKRNVLGTPVSGATLMTNPIRLIGQDKMLVIDNTNKAINASAVEYKEKWQTDNDVFNKFKTIQIVTNPPELVVNGNFSAGNTGFTSGFSYYQSCDSPPLGYYNICDAGAPHGNNMGFNGAALIAWQQTVSVQPDQTYTFSASFFNLNSQNVPSIQVYINDIPISNAFGLPANGWNTYSFTWNSSGNTSATIKIRDHTPNTSGNDFGMDDISFKAQAECTSQEVEDCTGYLEKKINPYRKGLLGTFRTHRSLVFYGERMESDPLTPTNIPVNGFLKDFKLHWNFNADNNLVPDPDVINSKWVWNSEITRINAKGMELETKDALGIYTAAQYGYSKTTPIAIGNNSRADEMAYDGFEDYDYNDLLNNSVYNSCAKRHIDFSGLNIVNTGQAGFNAHTGKNVLEVLPGTSAKSYTISETQVSDYNLDYSQTETVMDYNTLGLNYDVDQLSCTPSFLSKERINIFNDFANNNINTHKYSYTIRVGTGMTGFSPTVHSTVSNSYFKKITSGGFYTFDIAFNSHAYPSSGAYTLINSSGTMIYKVEIMSMSGELLSTFQESGSYSNNPNTQSQSFQTFLCPGTYKIKLSMESDHSCTITGDNAYRTEYMRDDWFTIKINNASNNNYSSLNGTVNCIYTKPVPASSSMMNPVFFIPANKKMVFSAWVRESNTQVSSYNNNEVQLFFGTGNTNNITIKPAGPIIEGWQRYEGYFTAPTGVTAMDLKLVNNSGQPIYFDDIRLHPFNANMKSYVYDPVNLRLLSELDANNYASFYEYDEEGTLIRTKVETKQGIKTITESRSAKQKTITELQE